MSAVDSRPALELSAIVRADELESPEAAVETLFDELRAPLLRYILTFRLPLSDAEEIVQDTFLALFHHMRAGKPRDNLRGWLFTVAHRLASKRRHSAQWRLDQLIARFPLFRVAADPEPSPHERIEGAERRERLLAVVDCLPERDRCCLWLRAEGLNYREIAQALGVSLGSVANSLGRAFRRLQASETEVRR